jgi:hypothetical protein
MGTLGSTKKHCVTHQHTDTRMKRSLSRYGTGRGAAAPHYKHSTSSVRKTGHRKNR